MNGGTPSIPLGEGERKRAHLFGRETRITQEPTKEACCPNLEATAIPDYAAIMSYRAKRTKRRRAKP